MIRRQNKNKIEKNVGPLVQSLVGHIKEFLSEYVQKPNAVAFNDQRSEQKNQRTDSVEKEEKESETSHEMITDFRKPEPETVEMKKGTGKKTKEEQVLEACENLRRLSTVTEYDHEKIENQVSQLGQKFREVVDGLLENHIQVFKEKMTIS